MRAVELVIEGRVVELRLRRVEIGNRGVALTIPQFGRDQRRVLRMAVLIERHQPDAQPIGGLPQQDRPPAPVLQRVGILDAGADVVDIAFLVPIERSEEHTSELQSLMRISYAVFCLTKKK